MVFPIVSLIIVLAVSGIVLYLVLQNSTGRTDEFVGETMDAWRNKELKNTDFEVKVTRGSVTDLFDTFQRDDEHGYLTVDEISAAVQGVAAYAPKIAHKPSLDSDQTQTGSAEVDGEAVASGNPSDMEVTNSAARSAAFENKVTARESEVANSEAEVEIPESAVAGSETDFETSHGKA